MTDYEIDRAVDGFQEQLARLDAKVTMLTDENARLHGALAAIRDLHRPFQIYGECGHTDHQPGDPGVVEVDSVGLTCDEGWEAVICHQCCTGGSGYQTQECADHHGIRCWPCPTTKLATLHGEGS